MANNRLYLVHRPTGFALFLGKRMLRGWYSGDGGIPEARLNAFYDRIDALYGEAPKGWNLSEALTGQDDFILVLEDNSCAPHIAEHTAYEGHDSSDLIVRFTPAPDAPQSDGPDSPSPKPRPSSSR